MRRRGRSPLRGGIRDQERAHQAETRCGAFDLDRKAERDRADWLAQESAALIETRDRAVKQADHLARYVEKLEGQVANLEERLAMAGDELLKRQESERKFDGLDLARVRALAVAKGTAPPLTGHAELARLGEWLLGHPGAQE